MRRFVLDCSVTMTWWFEDEADLYADDVLSALQTSEAIVPSIWVYEVVNVLITAERRKKLWIADVAKFLGLLRMLRISIEDPPMVSAIPSLFGIGRMHRLSAYDSAYLDLAIRRGLPLATLDKRLRIAAEDASVAAFDP